ncbi:MAG: hypothetical protein JO124_10905 [Hyphomicrobiales bacterium]|nr:hypothetical protein [Hyphomicrobiales bacterium]MBV9590858.1 hypothetical protein [Hyphomicrobiales bacterium]
MSLNPPLKQLFPRSALLVSLDDDMSCSVMCKCAMLIGCWHRMQWPIAFLRRVPSEGRFPSGKKAFSDAGDLIFDLTEPCPWNDLQFRAVLADFGTTCVTLAGSGLHDVLLGTAIGACAIGVPATLVTDAVQGREPRGLPGDMTKEALFALLEPFVLMMPTTAFVSTMESGV